MIRWSRVRLVLSIAFAEGFWRTWRERVEWASRDRAASFGDTSAKSLPNPPRFSDYAGVAHIHSTYSDGTGTVPEIAHAGLASSLDFILLADHNTVAAREAGDERWHADGRVLVAVGAEITTSEGHLLAFDVPATFFPSPWDAREAMEAIHAAGGYGYIALPCDLKGHWGDFGTRIPGIGLEVFNLSAIARTKINVPGFLIAMARYKGANPITAFSLVSGRPDRELRLWDDLMVAAAERNEPLPQGIGCLDAHAVMRIAGREYPYPTYEEVFHTLRTHALTMEPMSASNEMVERDLAILHEAIRSGRSYVAYDNYGDPKGFIFELRRNGQYFGTAGERFDVDVHGDSVYTLAVRVPHSRSVIHVYRNGECILTRRGAVVDYRIDAPGVYRVEVARYRNRIGNLCLGARGWIFSNAMHIAVARKGHEEPTAVGHLPAVEAPGR
ncbi:MAG TPA: hypothetical protein VGK19_00465 [Capsulimonadaceae bacterium]|jgi:hypothetical protein